MGHHRQHQEKEKESETSHSVTAAEAMVPYISPISKPLVDGKLAERSMKLIRMTLEEERQLRTKVREKTPGAPLKAPRLLRRGVVEVTKAIRKGEKGIVYLAADVYPIDIIAHLPVFCEEKDVVYAFLPGKQALGAVCRSSRPASAIMIAAPTTSSSYKDVFAKVDAATRKCHPHFN